MEWLSLFIMSGLLLKSSSYTITATPVSSEVHEGQDATLRCTIQLDNDEAFTSLQWLRDGMTVSGEPEMSFEANPIRVTNSLTLTDLLSSDAGEYECEATLSDSVKASATIQLYILFSPRLSDGETRAVKSEPLNILQGWPTLVKFDNLIGYDVPVIEIKDASADVDWNTKSQELNSTQDPEIYELLFTAQNSVGLFEFSVQFKVIESLPLSSIVKFENNLVKIRFTDAENSATSVCYIIILNEVTENQAFQISPLDASSLLTDPFLTCQPRSNSHVTSIVNSPGEFTLSSSIDQKASLPFYTEMYQPDFNTKKVYNLWVVRMTYTQCDTSSSVIKYRLTNDTILAASHYTTIDFSDNYSGSSDETVLVALIGSGAGLALIIIIIIIIIVIYCCCCKTKKIKKESQLQYGNISSDQMTSNGLGQIAANIEVDGSLLSQMSTGTGGFGIYPHPGISSISGSDSVPYRSSNEPLIQNASPFQQSLDQPPLPPRPPSFQEHVYDSIGHQTDIKRSSTSNSRKTDSPVNREPRIVNTVKNDLQYHEKLSRNLSNCKRPQFAYYTASYNSYPYDNFGLSSNHRKQRHRIAAYRQVSQTGRVPLSSYSSQSSLEIPQHRQTESAPQSPSGLVSMFPVIPKLPKGLPPSYDSVTVNRPGLIKQKNHSKNALNQKRVPRNAPPRDLATSRSLSVQPKLHSRPVIREKCVDTERSYMYNNNGFCDDDDVDLTNTPTCHLSDLSKLSEFQVHSFGEDDPIKDRRLMPRRYNSDHKHHIPMETINRQSISACRPIEENDPSFQTIGEVGEGLKRSKGFDNLSGKLNSSVNEDFERSWALSSSNTSVAIQENNPEYVNGAFIAVERHLIDEADNNDGNIYCDKNNRTINSHNLSDLSDVQVNLMPPNAEQSSRPQAKQRTETQQLPVARPHTDVKNINNMYSITI